MQAFLKRLLVFSICLALVLEVLIRALHLTTDIPERYVDEHGIQRYKPNQKGYYVKAKEPWEINAIGFNGRIDTSGRAIVGVIGDSYIENFMNPSACHQGILLKQAFPSFAFFEAARSGVTFIEALEISKLLDHEINTQFHVMYFSNMDFYESMYDLKPMGDRMQISLKEQRLMPAQLKHPFLKKLLYASKLVYYFYLRFPIFVSKQNKAETAGTTFKEHVFHQADFDLLFQYCRSHYNLNNFLWVFHAGVDPRIIATAQQHGIKTILLQEPYLHAWARNKNDLHWSCEGHQAISRQVADSLKPLLQVRFPE
ncbi:MAG: hypothetical protein FGM54_03210 [Chitinophagaceae bacterium]|nr:hypothetical protein [Chitinophagaceae bacterium]